MSVNHAHVKLYPMHGLAESFTEMWGDHSVYFEKYTGYITTLVGPEASDEDLTALAARLRG